MKILLINPTGGPEGEYGALSKAGTELPQLGLASVATALTKANHEVRIIDCHMEHVRNEDLIDIVRSELYELVGFSVYVTTEVKTFELAHVLKESLQHVKICVGGPQVTLVPDRFHKPYIDYVFIGESDYSIVEFVDALEKGEYFPDIKGVLYNDGERLFGSRELNVIDDLDTLPLIDLDRFYNLENYYPPINVRGKKVINVLSVRGCPFQCTFCAAAEISGRRLRKMSAGHFADVIESYIHKGYDSFMIYDDTFTVDRKRAIEISKEFIKRKFKISWNCWARVDCVDRDMLSYMKDSGCYQITFGCESFNDHTLKKIKKGFSTEQALNGIEITKNAGLIVYSSFMIGLPGETRTDILNTIKMVNKSRIDIAVYAIFEPYLGTPIYEDCTREGQWIKSGYKNRLLVDQDEIWVPNTISREEIEKLVHYAFRTFYFRPHFFNSFCRIFMNLPVNRKMRFVSAGFDYFIGSRLHFFKKKRYIKGSRYV